MLYHFIFFSSVFVTGLGGKYTMLYTTTGNFFTGLQEVFFYYVQQIRTKILGRKFHISHKHFFFLLESELRKSLVHFYWGRLAKLDDDEINPNRKMKYLI